MFQRASFLPPINLSNHWIILRLHHSDYLCCVLPRFCYPLTFQSNGVADCRVTSVSPLHELDRTKRRMDVIAFPVGSFVPLQILILFKSTKRWDGLHCELILELEINRPPQYTLPRAISRKWQDDAEVQTGSAAALQHQKHPLEGSGILQHVLVGFSGRLSIPTVHQRP